MRTVTPSFFNATYGQVRATFDSVNLAYIFVLLLSSLNITFSNITHLPDFTPTPYMLEKHADKGEEPWEIYAWCVRDSIAHHSGKPKLDEKLDLKDKRAFEALMNCSADRVEINGQIWEYKDG